MQAKGRIALLSAALAVAIASTPALASSPKDNEITTWVRSALRHDPHVDPVGIKIEVKDGIVTLNGSVDNLAAKNFAIDEAKKIDGVVGVIDQLYVKAAFRPDTDITQDVRHRIINNEMIESSWISTLCKDGVVTLTGTVTTWPERQEAGIVAGEVRGVQKVINLLSIDYGLNGDDKEIQKECKAKLDLDVYLNGLPITVAVKNGVVTLTGSVGSQFEKDRAERELRYLPNVKGVENDLLIKYWEEAGTRSQTPKAPSNRELKKRIKYAIEQDTRVPASKIDVAASSGHVTLSGSVPYSYQKRFAEQDARDTIGTAWVTNNLKVTGVKRSDAAIRSDILANLDSDYTLGGMDITVRVNNAKATLGGYANSNWEKQRAKVLAERVRGVKKIKNHIKVERNQYSDKALANDVRNRLTHNWITSPIHKNVRVSVDDGVVTLKGDVNTWRERIEAARVALGTIGIGSVRNQLSVRGIEYPWNDWVDEFTVYQPYWWTWTR